MEQIGEANEQTLASIVVANQKPLSIQSRSQIVQYQPFALLKIKIKNKKTL